MKKIGYGCFLAVGIMICAFPFVSMTYARTDKTTEKKKLAELPSVIENGQWNREYLENLGTYFEDHFAFRQKLVALDSWMEASLFQKTNIDNVIVGKDGWLYYKDSWNDYSGKTVMSDQALENIVYNLSVMQKAVEEQGKKFVFTIAPNKNSLYGQYMPYTYSYKYSDTNNRKLLEEKLKKAGIHYVDLFEKFSNEEEILYFKRDSHWNNKGAKLAYNALLDEAKWSHENYEKCDYEIRKDYVGDLNSMVYPEMEKKEANYYYNYEKEYQYINKGKKESIENTTVSVEDARVQTEAEKKQGTLVMYRDSFGNALLPFMANEFKNGYFFKTTPYNLGMHFESMNPDVVIVEKVERKLEDLAIEPAVMEGNQVEPPRDFRTVNTDTTLKVTIPEANTFYYEVFGVLDEQMAAMADAVYIEFIDKEHKKKAYQTFLRSVPGITDCGYVSYVPAKKIKNSLQMKLYIKNGKDVFCIKEEKLDIKTIEPMKDSISEEEVIRKKQEKKSNIEVTVLEKGKKRVVETKASSIQEMVEFGELNILPEDRIKPSIDTKLVDGEEIFIQRVIIKKKKVVKEIPFKTKKENSDALYEGEKQVKTEGEKGEKTITYQMTYVDGKLEKKEKIETKITKKPITKVVITGTRKKPTPTPKPVITHKPVQPVVTPSGKRVVSKEWVEDCGGDSGYYIITYSDGSVEYVDG